MPERWLADGFGSKRWNNWTFFLNKNDTFCCLFRSQSESSTKGSNGLSLAVSPPHLPCLSSRFWRGDEVPKPRHSAGHIGRHPPGSCPPEKMPAPQHLPVGPALLTWFRRQSIVRSNLIFNDKNVYKHHTHLPLTPPCHRKPPLVPLFFSWWPHYSLGAIFAL